MSRIGKLPVLIPDTVDVKCNDLNVLITGPKGFSNRSFQGDILIELVDGKLIVTSLNDTKASSAMRGTVRSIINNMVRGVSEGFSEEVEIVGVGYKASIRNNYLNLSLGKSHNTKVFIPKGIDLISTKQNTLIVSSNDKEKLGGFISVLIKQREPEPYKGKGIKIKGRYVQRKEGKKG